MNAKKHSSLSAQGRKEHGNEELQANRVGKQMVILACKTGQNNWDTHYINQWE